MICDDGACKPESQTTSPSCQDSDGKDTSVKGYITLSNGKVYYDYCMDSTTVTERICNGDYANIEEIYCGAGMICDDGACKPESQTTSCINFKQENSFKNIFDSILCLFTRLFGGSCSSQKTPSQNNVKYCEKCLELDGSICGPYQTCNDVLIRTSDSDACCIGECEYKDACLSISNDIPDVWNKGINAPLVINPDFRNSWKYTGVEDNIFINRNVLRDAIENTVKDAKRMGFNAIIISPANYPYNILENNFYYNREKITYSEFVEMFAEACDKYGLALIPGIDIYPAYFSSYPNRDEIWIKKCQLKESKDFVDRLSKYSSVKGFWCPFEKWGMIPERIKFSYSDKKGFENLRNYLNDGSNFDDGKRRFYLNIPATETYPPSGLFNIVTPQLAPNIYYNQEKMDSVVKEYSGYKYPKNTHGIQMNLWHSQIMKTKTKDESYYDHYDEWLEWQRNSVLKYNPKHITLFLLSALNYNRDYDYLPNSNIPNTGTDYHNARGTVMNVIKKRADDRLLLFDPFESRDSTEIIGGVVNGVRYIQTGMDYQIKGIGGYAAKLNASNGIVLKYPLIDRDTSQNNINRNSGTITFWVRPYWKGNDNKRHVFFSTICKNNKNCLRIEKTADNKIRFAIYNYIGGSGNPVTVDIDVSQWKPYEWHYIAASWRQKTDGPNMYIMVDDTINSKKDYTTYMKELNGNIIIGGWDAQTNADSIIDDLRIYGNFLSFNEARSIRDEILCK